VLLFTFLNSCGSAILNAGIFFIARNQYGFDDTQRFLLGLLYGVIYIPAAFYVGPLLRRLARRGVGPRSLLIALMAGMGLICLLPAIASALGVRGSWPLWVLVAVYSPLSGALWANVESYLAGGRSGHTLRAATGKFNITWSTSIVVTLLLVSPAVEKHSLLVLGAMSIVHALCIAVLLLGFRPSPGEHAHEDHSAAPEIYARLLAVCRLLLPMSFLLMSVVAPVLPTIVAGLGIAEAWGLTIAAVWPAARVTVFFLMERWHGWHGRWWPIAASGALLLACFAGIVLSPSLGLTALLLALVGFGIGMGVIYCAALYYAMEVSDSGVDAGGTHEAMIGLGYTLGPICGLIPAGLVAAGTIPGPARDGWMIGLAGALAAVVALAALAKGRRHARIR
jgi:MFS family permease